jgi:hypothetical protein
MSVARSMAHSTSTQPHWNYAGLSTKCRVEISVSILGIGVSLIDTVATSDNSAIFTCSTAGRWHGVSMGIGRC